MRLAEHRNMKGPNHPKWKGEHAQTSKDGVMRVYVWIPDMLRDQLGLKGNTIPRSRYNWLMAHPDQILTRRDVIHHKNGDTLDDRPENLERLASQHIHAKIHEGYLIRAAQKRKQPSKSCEQCGAEIRPWRRFCSQACFKVWNHGPNHQNYGQPMPDYQKRLLGEVKRGRKWSEDRREHMREVHRARWANTPRKMSEGHRRQWAQHRSEDV